jgi:hypothetical protein
VTGYTNLARVLYKIGDFEGSLVLYEKALVIHESVLGKDNPTTAAINSNLALSDNELMNG